MCRPCQKDGGIRSRKYLATCWKNVDNKFRYAGVCKGRVFLASEKFNPVRECGPGFRKNLTQPNRKETMNVLILQGSPRANGNTAWMAEEFKKAAEAAGHKVTLVDVAHKKIAGCLACEYCHGKGNGTCVQKDDMQELSPLLAEAEALVLASPIYYFGMSAQIQAPIQRVYNVNKPAKVKKMALLLSSYSPDVYDGATAQYRGICSYWEVEDAGVVTAKIDEQKTEATLAKIAALAAKL